MPQTQIFKIYEENGSRRGVPISSIEELHYAMNNGTKLIIAYRTPSGKIGQITFNKDIIVEERKRVAPSITYLSEKING